MNPITKAIRDVRYNIPPEILNLTFIDLVEDKPIGVSLDEIITSTVIRPRVLMDCNLVGGIELDVRVRDCGVMDNRVEHIITVPRRIINNANIMSALTLSYSYDMVVDGGYNDRQNGVTYGDETTSKLMDVMNSRSAPPINITSNLELIGNNVVLVGEWFDNIREATLRVIVENSSDLGNISPRGFLAFSDLVLLAVKAYVYNYTRVKINKGAIYGGHELSTVNSIVDEYADANVMYLEYLRDTWTKVAFMSDSKAYDDYISGLF